MFSIQNIENHFEYINEIETNIKEKYKTDSQFGNTKFEIEHGFVDFRQLIIGEKIKRLNNKLEENSSSRKSDFQFNNYELALLIGSDENSLNFYRQETIQNLIDF